MKIQHLSALPSESSTSCLLLNSFQLGNGTKSAPKAFSTVNTLDAVLTYLNDNFRI